ncbi:Flp pilus assembly protein CpaB [Methylobacterium durans]|uniref:Flp pilus assembly protein CpaB n=1 Tax=Methylobacterium durans TaxID=2202825 RepID=A0A2U8WDQ0_9HYPH|nr:Flp pilus assembly protein CpaB [Methylobacterium durans]AWN44243.1 Flp pilus assembly protein CpaB [Methylobacterium durans]
MKPARLAVLAIALVAGGGAAYLMSGDEPPPPPVAQAEPTPPPVPVAEVLVAAVELPLGQTLQAADLRWQKWPQDAVAAGYITRSASPKGIEETAGSVLRGGFLPGEPIRQQKLAKAGSGFMSSILPAGMRAVAIVTDTRGSNSAGGFILPNDHVDVIRTFRDEEASRAGGGEVQRSEIILQDVRVLAVGQLIQEKNGANVVTGETATLALTPAQAETITLAQKVGALSLALRSLVDSGRGPETEAKPQADAGLTVVRFGISRQQSR